jgi:eukaryotic-like serine/threonine-protein kinase
MEALRPGDPLQVGAYRLLARLGGGGMGTVYLGRTAGGRTVAVKLIRTEFTADPEFRRRFQQEVTAARRVSGRWTPPVLDADTDGQQPWVATAYVPGPDLAEALRRFGPLPLPTVRTLGAGLAEGLLTLHNSGLVHRDVKPSNVLLSLDGPRVIDFGIARALDGTGTALTQTGTVIGSPGYMSPEQATGHPAGPASDIFSLGAVLAVAATGRPPFGEGPTAVAVMYRVLHEQPDLDGLPGTLCEIVAACLDKDPTRRPPPQQIRTHLLPEPDATVPQRGWLPPAISEAVARMATELLHLDAPQAQAPPPPSSSPTAPSWHTMPATQFEPPSFAPALIPGAARRPRRRSLAMTALVTAAVTTGVVWAVLANGSHGGSTGSATATDAPSTSGAAAAGTSAKAASNAPAQSTPGKRTGAAPNTSAASGDLPAGMLGTWQYNGGGSAGDGYTVTVAVTLHQGRLGGAVGTLRSTQPDGVTCQAVLRLASAGSDRITVNGTDPTGGSECQSADISEPVPITQESAAAIALSPGDGSTPIELIKQN